MPYVSTMNVSAVNTPENPQLRDLGMVPLGAAVWTGSGDLSRDRISGIVQAAPGAMGHQGRSGLDPTRESVAASIQNAFLLAAAHRQERLALPFIAGGIFFHRIRPAIGKEALAQLIVGACIEHRAELEAVITAHGTGDMGLFKQAMAGSQDPGVKLMEGSITRFADHQCAVIANAANMEVVFGGGLSGIIGAATGQGGAIDREAAAAVQAFWAANPEQPV